MRKKNFLKYLFDFIVIVLGITVSFWFNQLSIKKSNDLERLKVLNSIEMEISEIENYTKNDSQHQKINKKINELNKYIDVYLQNKICHGDLHLGNIFLNRNKFYFLDWDYYVLSSSGYDLAMFAYLEKLNNKQIEKISLYSKVSLEEIHHYLPICQLLDYLYLSLDRKNNCERARKLKLKVDKFILNNL